jgi:uncharacterized protein YjiS (DUF1127 family)
MLSQNDHKTTPANHPRKADPVLLRDDHLVLLLIDGLLAVHAAVRRWFKRRRTRQILAALDAHQLRDIGLTRADIASCSRRLSTVLTKRAEVRDIGRRALADLDDSQLSNLSEAGLKLRREARREHYRD